MATTFENAQLITSIDAHYTTPSGLQRIKTFADDAVASYLKWERSVERMGYDINCLDTSYAVGYDRAGNFQKEPIGPVEHRQVRNLMSGALVWEPKDTPYTCSVSSESYWSQ